MEPGQIYCVLTPLLQERGISLNRVAKDTGIAYTTLHRLATNKIERLDLSALGKVCEHLGVVPGDVLRVSGQDQVSTTIEPEALIEMMLKMGIESVKSDVIEFENGRGEILQSLKEKLQAQINEYIELESNLIMENHRQQTKKNAEVFFELAGMVLPPNKYQEFLEKQETDITLQEFTKSVKVGKQLLPIYSDLQKALSNIVKTRSSELMALFQWMGMEAGRQGENFDFGEFISKVCGFKMTAEMFLLILTYDESAPKEIIEISPSPDSDAV